MKADPTFDIQQYLRVLRRRAFLLLIPVVVLTIFVGAGSLLIDDVYQANAQLVVRPEMDAVSGLAVRSRIDQQMDSIIAGLQRPDGQRAIVEKLRDQRPAELTEDQLYVEFGRRLMLKRNTRRGADTWIDVVFQGHPKEFAIAVVNAFAEEIELQGTRQVSEQLLNTIEFVDESLTDYNARLEQLDIEGRGLLAELERELGDVAHIGAQRGLTNYVSTALAAYDSEGRRLDAVISGLEARVRMIENYLNQVTPTMPVRAVDAGTAAAISAIEQQVAQNRLSLVALGFKYTDRHPAMQEMEIQGDELRAYLDRLKQQAKLETQEISNPNYEQAQIELVRTASALDEAKANRGLVSDRSGRLRKFYYDRVPELEARLSRVQQQQEVLTETRDRLLTRRDQLNLNQSFEGKNTQRFELRRALDYAMRPLRPNRKKIAILGFMAGLFVGISFVLLAEYLDHAVRSEYDLRRYVDAPILAVLPRAPR